MDQQHYQCSNQEEDQKRDVVMKHYLSINDQTFLKWDLQNLHHCFLRLNDPNQGCQMSIILKNRQKTWE